MSVVRVLENIHCIVTHRTVSHFSVQSVGEAECGTAVSVRPSCDEVWTGPHNREHIAVPGGRRVLYEWSATGRLQPMDFCSFNILRPGANGQHFENKMSKCIFLTLNMRGPSYLGLTRSISWLLMPWLLTSPGHQQPWCWLYRICRYLSYLRKDFKYLCHINVEEWHQM